MEKVRVYELAKELNTTSKRLMEKLAEINVEVKNHMSLLESHELEALYKHIGVIRHDDKKTEQEPVKAPPSPSVQLTSEQRREAKKAPRIIRTTEVIISSSDAETDMSKTAKDGYSRGGSRKGGHGFVVSSDSNSGLRAGFVRDTDPDYTKLISKARKTERKATKTETPAVEKRKADKSAAANKIEKSDKVVTGVKKDKDVVKKDKEIKAVKEVKEAIDAKDIKKEIKKDIKKKDIKAEIVEAKKDEPSDMHDEKDKPKAKPEVKKTEKSLEQEPKKEKAKDKELAAKTDSQGIVTKREEKTQRGKTRSDKPQYQGDRPQSDKPQYKGSRVKDDRPQYTDRHQSGAGNRQGSKSLEIPKPDFSAAKNEEIVSQRSESRREFFGRDSAKDNKRELRKEVPRIPAMTKAQKKIRPTHIGLSEKKGLSEILSEDFILNEFYNDTGSKKKKQSRPKKDKSAPAKYIPPRAVLTSIKVPDSITVKELAERLKKTSGDVIKKLIALGVMATLNEEVDFDTAAIVAEEFGVTAEKEIIINDEDILFDDSEDDDPDKLVTRPPVVVVMGHVDHGKTSLLDAIRSTNVTDKEAGGITQHIGAYSVKIKNRNITFLDTPGHEAFTAMRARGAQATDIAILVVAADDGVMPQTVEAINHAKAANVSIIVAINKIDKPGANPERVKQELTQHGLVPEEWGGDIICVNVSAKNHENIDQLLEMVLLTADIMELKADPTRQAKGTVIEAKLDKNRGSIATLLVQRGTLKVGDSIVTGTTVGRIRAMVNDKREPVQSAGPSTPVEILGLPEVPEAGEVFYAITDEKVAKHLVESRKNKLKEQQMMNSSRVTLDDLYKQISEGTVKDLNIIVKADVQGTVEALKQSLDKLSNDEVRVKIIHGGVGAINESDVTLADVSNAIIIGFNVRPVANVTEAAANAGVDIRLYRVIYNAIEDIEAAMKGMLAPTFKEVVLGHTEVRQIFKVSDIGTIAGCYVLDGKIVRNSEVRVVRDGIVIYEGKLASLKRFKDDVREVVQGYECGLSIERYNDIKEGDIIESFVMEEVKR